MDVHLPVWDYVLVAVIQIVLLAPDVLDALIRVKVPVLILVPEVVKRVVLLLVPALVLPVALEVAKDVLALVLAVALVVVKGQVAILELGLPQLVIHGDINVGIN